MSRDEIRTRLTQSVNKRLDVAWYRAGLSPRGNSLTLHPAEDGKFFFAKRDVPHIADLLQARCRAEVDEIVRRADGICRHQFQLLGYDRVDYGAEIDWHLDAVHGKRAPLKPWFNIPFLKFSEVGDHKVTWELNRHQHLVTLAKAWSLTRQEKYGIELVRQWYSWKRTNPFPIGINWASSLEVGFRSLSWLWVKELLADLPSIPEDFNSDLLQALALSGRYIERHLSTYFSANTHLLGEAVALMFIGVLCPEIAQAQRWRTEGWRIVVREAERQVLPDGVYFEQSLYYHVYALDLFLHARILANHNRIEIPAGFDATLLKMLDVLLAVSQAGPPHAFGDDDGGRVFDPGRNRSEHLTDPLAIGAILFDRDDLRPVARLTEESVWLLGDRACSFFAQPRAALEAKAQAFQAGGIYVMASGDHGIQQMTIDAGPHGTGRGGHGHADALNATVSFSGRQWLVDSGSFCYVSAGTKRDQFRGTGSHNTLRVDGLDQAVPEGPFAWTHLPKVLAERWCVGSTFALFAGSHSGYSRLPQPVLHRRFVFHLHGNFWLVRDLVTGGGRHRLEASWHFSPDLKVEIRGSAVVASEEKHGRAGGARMALVASQDPVWACELGWAEISPAYGKKLPTQIARLSAHCPLPTECATIVLPLMRNSDVPGKLAQSSSEADLAGNVCSYRYDEPGVTHSMIFSSGREGWNTSGCESDAEFVYYCIRNGEPAHFILCNGSFARLGGHSVLNHGSKIARIEWRRVDGSSRVDCSEDAAFSEDALRSRDLAF